MRVIKTCENINFKCEKRLLDLRLLQIGYNDDRGYVEFGTKKRSELTGWRTIIFVQIMFFHVLKRRRRRRVGTGTDEIEGLPPISMAFFIENVEVEGFYGRIFNLNMDPLTSLLDNKLLPVGVPPDELAKIVRLLKDYAIKLAKPRGPWPKHVVGGIIPISIHIEFVSTEIYDQFERICPLAIKISNDDDDAAAADGEICANCLQKLCSYPADAERKLIRHRGEEGDVSPDAMFPPLSTRRLNRSYSCPL